VGIIVLPPEIGNLTKLVELALNENCLTELPQHIGRLTTLEILLLSHNKLRALPASIGDLVNLHTFNLDHNQLRALPPEIGKLTRLRRLNIQDNLLSELPKEFAQIESLQDFDWKKRKGLPPRNVRNFISHGNPWLHPPAEIMKKEVDAVRDYLKGESLDNPLLNGNGMNWDRWASPPSPDSNPPASNPPDSVWNPPPSPLPPPLPRITAGLIIPAAPCGYSFQSIIELPPSTEQQTILRLRKDFPEINWQDQPNSPRSPIEIWMVRQQSPGPFHLTVAIAAPDQSQAHKLHHEFIRRLTWALIGWSPFPLPHFKPRSAALDTEVIINLPSHIEGPLITISDINADILISRTLVEALSLHGEVLKVWVSKGLDHDDPANQDAIQRGNAARCLLLQSASRTASEDLEGILTLVRPAHNLLTELLELGLAQVIYYGLAGRAPGGKSISQATIKLHRVGSYISCGVAEIELLRLHPQP
jgi:Leucine-rich repeat (LRR) protein